MHPLPLFEFTACQRCALSERPDTPRSSVVQRVCYDQARRRLLVNAGGAYSEYCGLPAATFDAFVVAPSMGQFFRQRIAAPATQFGCDSAN